MTPTRPPVRWIEPGSGQIRQALVAHIREQIAAGTYVTPGKLGIVADRLAEILAEPNDPEETP